MSPGHTVDIEARVLSVRVLDSGAYGLTLGPPPDLYYVVADEPLRVGAKVSAKGPVLGVRSLPGDATLTQIGCDELRAVGDATERYVHDEWLERVDLVCRRPLYDYQREGAAWLASRLARKRGSIIADDMGLGKQHPVDTKVLTPIGWRDIGDVQVGDEVIGSTGAPTKVLGVFPQGVKPSYRVRFSDGSSVEAGSEHLWTVKYWRGGRQLQEIVVTTDQIRTGAVVETRWPNGVTGRMSLAKTHLYLPLLSAPVRFGKARPLPLPAYLVGQLIANGSLVNDSAVLTTNTADSAEVLARLRSLDVKIGACHVYDNATRFTILGAIAKVRALGMNVFSPQKRVPQPYLRASSPDRVALLQGLMDGDGSCSLTGNRVIYHTTSTGLAADVIELVEQLGGIATVHEYDRTHEQKPLEYQVRIKLPLTIKPFSTRRKASRLSAKRRLPTRTIVSVDYVRDVESVCIRVAAADSLYATEHCILTHNTMQVVAAALAAETFPMIVVCPFTLKKEWRNELQQSATPLSIEELETGNRDYIHPAQVYLVHYDILKPRKRQLRHLGAKLVVFDEGHLLKEPRPHATHRAAVATELAHHIGLAVVATGTPLLNGAAEYWRLLHIVDPKNWPSYADYAERYTHLPTDDELREDPAAQKRIVTSFGRVERSEELQSRVEAVLIRRTKEETTLDLPGKDRRILPLDLDERDRFEYERARKDLATWYTGHGQDLRASRAVRTEALMKLSVLRQIAAMAKMRRAVPEYLAGWFGREVVEPIVVFGYHRAPLACLADLALHMKIRAGAILGTDSSEASRAAVVDAFRAGEIDMLIAPIRIAGIGLNLQNAARAMFLEWTWVPADMEQAEARIDRIGQRRRTVIDYLAARGTIDDHMAEVIAGKQVLIDQLVDGEIRHEKAIEVDKAAAETGGD